MRELLLVPVVALSLGLSACVIVGDDWGAHYNKDFHSNYPLKAGGRVSVETFNGSVEVSGWDENTVDIVGTKFASTQSEADNMRVDIDATPDSVSIRVPRPALGHNQGARFVIKVPNKAVLSRISTSNASIRTQNGAGPARLKSSNGSIHVTDFQGALDAETSNSTVELMNVQGDVVAHSSNGPIRAVHLAGSLDASTSNGSIQGSFDRADRPVRAETNNNSVELSFPPHFASDVRVNTSNGGITVRLPDDFRGQISARTSNASVTSDFDIQSHGELKRSQIEGVIGSGGPLIQLNTSNSGIHLQRR